MKRNVTFTASKMNRGVMHQAVFLFAVLLILVISAPASAQIISAYQQEAAQNNPGLEAKYRQYLAALEDPAITSALPNPEVSFSYFIKPIETRLGPQQGRISVSQMLPWFGSLGDRQSASTLRAKAEFEQFQEARNRLFYQVEKTVYDLYKADESIRLAEENLLILNSLVELSLSRYETHRASQVDVLRAQIEQEDLNIQIELLKDSREVVITELNELLNRRDFNNFQHPDSLGIASIPARDELLNRLSRQNPDLNRLRFQEEAAGQMKSLARKQNLPNIMLGADYIFTGESNMANISNSGEDALMVMAGFSIPIFRNKNSARVRQADQNIRDLQFQLSDRQNALQTDINASIRDFEDARRRYRLYDELQIQRITQAINIMMEAYASDRSEFEEILRMQRKLLNYQLRRVQAIADQYQAKAFIEYLTGRHNINPE